MAFKLQCLQMHLPPLLVATVLLLLYRYEKAEEYFLLALQKMGCVSEQSVMAEKWEPLLNNLGHICRKLRYTTLRSLCVFRVYLLHCFQRLFRASPICACLSS